VGLRIVGREFVPGKGWDFTRFGPEGKNLRDPGIHHLRCEEFPPSRRKDETTPENRVHYFRQKVRAYAETEQIAHRVERLYDEAGELVGAQVAFAELTADLPPEGDWQTRPRQWEWDPRRWPDDDGGVVDLVALGQVVEIPKADYGGNFRRFRKAMIDIAKELEVEVEIKPAWSTRRRDDGSTKEKEVGAIVRFRAPQVPAPELLPQADPAPSDFSPASGPEYT
jgi:hypothetical protein